jgi:hypothetical protein
MRWRPGSLTAATAYLALAAHLCAIVHVVVVRHATCPTHGELVHEGGRAGASALTGEDDRAPAEPHKGIRSDDRASVESADEHCLVVATSRRDSAGLTAQTGAVLARMPQASGAVVDRDTASAVAFPLFLIAPKNSPPRASV